MTTKLQRFILLPPRGLQATAGISNPATTSFLLSLDPRAGSTPRAISAGSPRSKVKMKVLDSVHEDGAKLVELPAEQASDLRAEQPGVRIVPVVYYYPAIAPRPTPISSPSAAAAITSTKITLKVVSKKDGNPIANATVVAFTDFAQRIGKEGTTNSKGEIAFNFGASKKKLDRLYVFAKKNFWNFLKKEFPEEKDNYRLRHADRNAPHRSGIHR